MASYKIRWRLVSVEINRVGGRNTASMDTLSEAQEALAIEVGQEMRREHPLKQAVAWEMCLRAVPGQIIQGTGDNLYDHWIEEVAE